MPKHKDPITGDELTTGEWVSWKIQGVIRRWTFLVAITCVTVVVWSTNNPQALTWWNLCASYLAILIESIVGLAMFSQTRRDAVVLREIRASNKRIETLEDILLSNAKKIEEEIEAERL